MMDKIKKILNKNKNAFVILVENGEPAYVVLNFEEYEKLASRQEEFSFPGQKRFLAEPASEEHIFNEVNQEIINLQAPKEDVVEDELRLMRIIAKFTSILDRMKIWISNEAPDMIRWGEGVIFDKNGKTKKIPFNSNYDSIFKN